MWLKHCWYGIKHQIVANVNCIGVVYDWPLSREWSLSHQHLLWHRTLVFNVSTECPVTFPYIAGLKLTYYRFDVVPRYKLSSYHWGIAMDVRRPLCYWLQLKDVPCLCLVCLKCCSIIMFRTFSWPLAS